jgi:hypothetical protein
MNPLTQLQKTILMTAAIALTVTAQLPAQSPVTTETLLSWMFGVARGEVARINVANVGDHTVEPIQVEMQFLDMTGNVVARGSETVIPGQAAFFDVPFDAFGTEGNRVETRVVIMTQHPARLDRNLRLSLEVFDAETGRNALFSTLSNVHE